MRTTLPRSVFVVLTGLAIQACGGDGGTDPVAVESIQVSPTSIEIAVGETETITAVPQDASGNALSGREVTFTPLNSQVATVTNAGVVTGVAEGSTGITVESEGVSEVVPVEVTPAPVASVEVTPDPLELIEGETGTLTATLRDALGNELTGRDVEWGSLDETVATVDQSREVTAVAEGQTTVTATSEGVSGGATVVVSPVPVASVEVVPDELDLVVGQQQALAVTLRDAGGNELTGRVVTFESDDEAVATVDGDGVVSAEGVGNTTVTVASEGQSAQVDVDVAAPAFEPQQDTEIDGDRTFASIDIPGGITVTVTGDAVIRSLGEVNVDGSVVSDCHEVQVISDGPVTVAGTVDTRCTTDPQADGNQLRIVGTGAMTFTGSTITAQGDLTVTNDSTLTLDDFLAADAMGVPARALRAASGPCSYNEISSPTRPKPATPDTQGKTGANGKDGRTTRWICDGDADFDGGVYEGQDAGDGEAGTGDAGDESQGPAEGGDGGDADELRILSSGSMSFSNGVTINLGDGGKGGDAERIAPPNRAAEASGGVGGTSGTLTVRAAGGITVGVGGLTVDIGKPGDGGNANAVGGDGDNSTTTEAAKDGGNATATGGKGGDTPDAQFRGSGVVGIDNIVLTGGPAGMGGKATATAGKGGDGVTDQFPNGAEGGDQTAKGGDGGQAPATDLRSPSQGVPSFGSALQGGVPFVDAGNGGDAELGGGVGGNGFDKCPPLEMGGNGGKGGNGDATGGARGVIGKSPGEHGEAIIQTGTGNGGKAGDGAGPGMRGMGGTESRSDGMDPPDPSSVQDNEPNYELGPPGVICLPVDPMMIQVTHIVFESPCPQLVGTFEITNPHSEPISVSFSSLSPHLFVEPPGTSIPAGGMVVVEVYFNCGTQQSFSSVITVFGTSSDGSPVQEKPLDVTVNIVSEE